MDLHTAAQTRLAGLGTRLAAVLREDAAVEAGAETEERQQMFDRHCSALHLLSHAGHAMSDIMLQFSRPPPRQLRARPFVIQSVLQSAVIQSVPVQLGGGPATAAAASTPPAGSTTASPGTATASSTSSTTTFTTQTGGSGANTAASQQHNAAHAAAHAEAVRQAQARAQGRRQSDDPLNAVEAILRANYESGPDTDFAQMVAGAIGTGGAQPRPGGGGVTAHMQPVVVGIELGPDSAAPGARDMHGIISSAIQQALGGNTGGNMAASSNSNNTGNTSTSTSNTTSSNTATTTSSSGPGQGPQQQGGGAGPQVQVAVGPTMSLPLGPPPPPGMSVGNLNSFDPFLPCSSRHLPAAGPGGQQRAGPVHITRRQTTRTVRSAPGSRAASVPRDMVIRAMMGGEPGAAVTNEADQGVMNMIQGVMGQVVGAMNGGGAGAGSQPTTIRQFLNTLPDYTYEEGESLVTDLLMTLAGHLTFQDMVSIVTQNPSPATIGNLQEPLKKFILEKVLQGAEPSEENIKSALLRIADDWFEQLVSPLVRLSRDAVSISPYSVSRSSPPDTPTLRTE